MSVSPAVTYSGVQHKHASDKGGDKPFWLLWRLFFNVQVAKNVVKVDEKEHSITFSPPDRQTLKLKVLKKRVCHLEFIHLPSGNGTVKVLEVEIGCDSLPVDKNSKFLE